MILSYYINNPNLLHILSAIVIITYALDYYKKLNEGEEDVG